MGVPQQEHEDQQPDRAGLSSAPPTRSVGDDDKAPAPAPAAADSGRDRPAENGVSVDSGGQSPVGQSPASPPPLPAANANAGGSEQPLDRVGNVSNPSEPFYPGTTASEGETSSKTLEASEGEVERRRRSKGEKSDGIVAGEEGHVRLPELNSTKRTTGLRQSSGSGVFGGGGGGNSGGVSVTVLTLDGTGQDYYPRPRSRLNQQLGAMSSTPRGSSSVEPWDKDSMTDLKLVRDFQIRRKYGRRAGHVPPSPSRDRFVDLGLSGTRYFNNNNNNNSSSNSNSITTAALDSPRIRKSLLEEKFGRLQHQNSVGGSSIPASPLVGRVDEEENGPKDVGSPVSSSFPPLSSSTVRAGVRSENSFYVTGRHGNGQSPSLLINHFGFTSIRPDTFSGIQNHRRVKIASEGNDDLLRELEHNAKRQILACQNMGYTHRGSRAAQSVLSLKDTVSPSAFQLPSFISRHAPRGAAAAAAAADDRASKIGTPGDALGADEGGRRKRLTHPAPGGKLSNRAGAAGVGGHGVTKLVVHDRQDREATRRATLPTVCGSSLQVMLAQSNGNEKLM